ncbi:TIGR03756 family integrating conjugative element protein [Salmonella enterica]|uniref:TIGR03756 family integrating conjugative element protein n=1 Tax=Salmonella diarizonae TaxID=59204 RepID=A0A5Y1YF73_SALDZ|nr:TIGR03756 family integrating conjugative element protein [Salmonella enterica]EBX5401705.1 TIGR03756 family integrating conjugative element protein [Salmonella enterica subsp. enterica serovar Java]ECC3917156.1 TIGR03756 family integrating conjugative element protein [Salmonella enterica subsp. diarizonae]EBE1092651.1 TIGR03756 family integrating conjugative element protein [Salmonella enterica]ECO8337948.1 TIGR03756 family integrating conjugative element protein [Salmonella enterica]
MNIRHGFSVSLLTVALPVFAITTPQITASSLSAECLQYRVVGLCYWLLCTPFGCTVKTSVKVKHNIPELVVSSYSAPGDNPWTEMKVTDAAAAGILSGGDTNPRITNSKTKIRYKDTAAIGHPGGVVFSRFLNAFGYHCNSPVVPFQPYFLSTLDAVVWRSGVPEMLYPEALTPLVRETGQPGDLWGNVYPRAGSLGQTHDYKASAVMAQRTADIVTRTGQLHVYLPLVPVSRPGYWPPQPVMEKKTDNHRWQLLSPGTEGHCAIFPDRTATDTYADRLDPGGDYAWTLWRPYSCCQRRGQTFLVSTGG